VGVFGVGPIGLATVALARAAGASKVVAIDPVIERGALARRMGAHVSLSLDELIRSGESPVEALRDLSNGGFDIHVEAAGAADETIALMERTLAPNGRIVYLGRTGATSALQLDTLVSGASELAGSRGHAGHGIYPNLIRMTAAGVIDLSVMVTQTFRFPEVEQALEAAGDRRQGKVMVTQP
jgi:hypothetical protein